MAYDDLTSEQLAAETRECLNQAENAMQRGMKRLTELELRVALCTCQHDHETPAPTPTPSDEHEHHEPPVAGWIKAADVTPIPSNFDIDEWLNPAPIPRQDHVQGAFRLTANVSHFASDDPIVFPGQPGASHLHMFFGNMETDAHSTYESLRASGHSTTDSDMVNRSAYWAPALLDGRGNAVVPDHITMYYKQVPSSSPDAIAEGTNLPAGLRMVFGANYHADPLREGERFVSRIAFQLRRGDVVLHDREPTLENILAVAQVGDTITAAVTAPDMWDGVHLDGPDHRSHMAYPIRDGHTGELRAPEGFPFAVPQAMFKFVWSVLEGDEPALWRFSSDGDGPVGASFHADLFEAWDPVVRQMWWENAIEKRLDCSGGDLGNGRKCKRWSGFTFAQRPHLVAVA